MAQSLASHTSSSLENDTLSRSCWEVTGHTTPNLADIGGSSVRLRKLEGTYLPDGGYLLGLRRYRSNYEDSWLPAIAGVPGGRGPDDHGNYRPGLAECMIFARPLEITDTIHQNAGQVNEVTTVHTTALEELLPVGVQVEVVVLERVTDFFLGLNSGQWLKIRLEQISEASLEFLKLQENLVTQNKDSKDIPKVTVSDLLKNTGFDEIDRVEDPPSEQRYKFEVGTSFVRADISDWGSLYR